MQKKLLPQLVCPKCKNKLSSSQLETEDGRVVEAKLFCRKCEQSFEIKAGIARFLNSDTIREQAEKQERQSTFPKEELSKEWLDKFSAEENKMLKKEWQWMISQSGLKESGIHLDWATGTARFAREIIPLVSGSVVLLEKNWNVCLELKKLLKKLGKYQKMSIICADARSLPFKDSFFDSVASWGGLDEPKIKPAIYETHRVLKEGSTFAAAGTHYEPDSKSEERAKKEEVGFKNKKETLNFYKEAGFNQVDYKEFYQGKWKTKQSFLPVPGDKYIHFGISGGR